MFVHSKLISIVLIILVFAGSALVWAGGNPEESPKKETASDEPAFEPITFIDASGREITITKPIKTIAYTHAFGDQIQIMGVWDRVVAIDGSHWGGAKHYPESEGLPVISTPGNCNDINYEKVLELNPDIFLNVCTPAIPGFEEVVEMLEPEIPVVAFNFSDPYEITNNFEKFGKILGREETAAEFIAWYNNLLSYITERTSTIPEKEKPRVFYKMGWGGIEELATFTDDFDIIPHRNKATGAINLAADLPNQGGWVMRGVDPEWLLEENPDVIIDGGMYHGIIGAETSDRAAAAVLHEQIMSLDVIAATDAGKNKQVYLIWTDSFMNPEFILNYGYIVKWLHPELFTEFDPQAVHQEYLTRFLKMDFDLSKQGVFVYP